MDARMKRIPFKSLRPLRIAAAIVAAATLAADAAQEWNWRLPAETYQRLDIPQRTSEDRASGLHARGEQSRRERKESDAVASFRAASQEWKRFTIEYVDAPESALAHAHFMQAYDLHLAKDRNEAVKIYTEVLDFYPDTPYAQVMALFWRGEAHRENGDQARAMADLAAIAEMEDVAGHPLAVVALERLAEDAWSRMQWEPAAARWQAIAEDQPDPPRDSRDRARRRLMMWRGLEERWDEVARIAESAGADAKARADILGGFMWSTWNQDLPNWLRPSYFERRFKGSDAATAEQKFRAKLVDWYAARRSVFAEAGRDWDHDLAVFNYRRQLAPDKASTLATELGAKLRASQVDAAEKERRARGLIDQLVQAGMAIEARTLLGFVPNAVDRLRLAYSIEERTGHFAEAESILGQLERNEDPAVVLAAKRSRAYLYKDRMNAPEKAIPLYIEIADPPGTLWALQECYWRVGKKPQAHATLTEIASVFPGDAARAMFQKADYFQRENDKAQAIAHYRRILAHPDWKKTGEASSAHQRLEQLGVDTGGAVIHGIN